MENDQVRNYYEEWLSEQYTDLDVLLQVVQTQAAGGEVEDNELRVLVAKSMLRYEENIERRRAMATEDAPAIFCPAWCNSIEGSLLWIGGCRASMAIRLVYSLAGMELEAQLEELMSGGGGGDRSQATGGPAVLSARQLELVNNLHERTLVEEEKLSARMATLQEDIADKPLLPIIKNYHRRREVQGCDASAGIAASTSGFRVVRLEGEVVEVMNRYAVSLAGILVEADRLRVATLKELAVGILSPMQAVELLIAVKQLLVSLHEWGRRIDQQNRRA